MNDLRQTLNVPLRAHFALESNLIWGSFCIVQDCHAADRLNSRQKEVVLNSEYPPASVAWAETHSQFCDALLGSIEWLTRYVKDKTSLPADSSAKALASAEALAKEGVPYPFELFERKLKKLQPLAPLGMMSIIFVSNFEREIYEAKNLTSEKVQQIAKRLYKKYFDFTEDSLLALSIPHIYAWDSSAYYHGYGLSELAVFQWREYFYHKYGYIVDDPRVGQEMIEVWKLGSSKTFLEFVKLATKKKLSADSYLKVVNRSVEEKIKIAKKRIKRLATVPIFNKKIDLKANIILVHGKKTITTNAHGFEKMAEDYSKWLKTMNNE
jgi:predicted nucleic-acid-binding protein